MRNGNATRKRIFTTILKEIENWSMKPLQRRNEITSNINSDIQNKKNQWSILRELGIGNIQPTLSCYLILMI